MAAGRREGPSFSRYCVGADARSFASLRMTAAQLTSAHSRPRLRAAFSKPQGRRAMIDVHYWPTPNGHKVTIFLEEAGLEYRIVPVNIGKGEQFTPAFLKISP